MTLLKETKSAIKNMNLFYFSWLFFRILLVGYFIGDAYKLPVSVFALGGELSFTNSNFFSKAVEPKHIIKRRLAGCLVLVLVFILLFMD